MDGQVGPGSRARCEFELSEEKSSKEGKDVIGLFKYIRFL